MFEVGDLVWVKKTNYPLWPAKISQPPKEKKKRKKSYVCFLGSEACDWVANKKIQHHAEHFIPPNYEKTLFLLKHAIDEIILLSKDKPFKEDTKASPQVVQNLEEKCMEGKQLMEEEQSPIERHSYKGKATFFKEASKRNTTSCRGKAARKRETTFCRGKAARKEKQPPVEEKQPSSKEPDKEKQPPVEGKQPEKQIQPPVEGKQPEKEKQPHVEENQSSLKKRVKNYHPLVEQLTLPTKRQRIGKKQPPIKQNQASINTNPVREKRKHLEQITSRGKVSKKAGDSVKSPRVVQRKRSLSKESVIGETSMIVPCSSKIQKIDEEDSLRSSHNRLSADLSNPKDLKSDAISEASSSSRDWHSGLLCCAFNITADDDDGSVSSSSSQQSPRCEIVRRRKDEPKLQNPDSPTVSNELTFSKDDIFIPHREPSPFEDDEYEKD
ncbi:hypothetical protein TNCV_1642981 [Trichonephila clavipes]|nr:hypothetical protein TNCV_1642981 [Trichonephila clavipes]